MREDIRRLREKLDKQEDELTRLRKIETNLARIQVSNRVLRLLMFLCGFGILIGTCFISQYASDSSNLGRGMLAAGWILVVFGLLAQFVFAVFENKTDE